MSEYVCVVLSRKARCVSETFRALVAPKRTMIVRAGRLSRSVLR